MYLCYTLVGTIVKPLESGQILTDIYILWHRQKTTIVRKSGWTVFAIGVRITLLPDMLNIRAHTFGTSCEPRQERPTFKPWDIRITRAGEFITHPEALETQLLDQPDTFPQNRPG